MRKMNDHAQTMINVAFIADSQYLQHLAVCITSLLKSNSQRPFMLFVLLVEPSCPEISKLRDSATAFPNARIVFLSIPPTALAGFKTTGHVTVSALTKLYLAALLPPDVHRALYLDCDIVVRGDIADLYDADLENLLIGAVEDLPNLHPNIGFTSADKYFNSGVMLLDLKGWRECSTTNSLLQIATSGIKLVWPDQDILNLHFKAKFRPLDIKWNFQAVLAERPTWFNLSGKEFRRVRDEACVIHFTSPCKPWNYMDEVQYRELYYRYLSLTPFKKFTPIGQTLRNRMLKFGRALVFRRKAKWVLAPIIQIRNPFRSSESRQADRPARLITRTYAPTP